MDFVSTAVEESVREGAHKYAEAKLSKGYPVTQGREIIGGPKNAGGKNRQWKTSPTIDCLCQYPIVGPAMFFDLVGMMAYHEFSKIDDALEAYRRDKLEEAKADGLEAVKALLKSWKWWNGVGRVNGEELKDHQIEYRLLDITFETAMKIKQGEFKTYRELDSFIFQDEGNKNITILCRNQYDSIRKGRVYIIETFFTENPVFCNHIHFPSPFGTLSFPLNA